MKHDHPVEQAPALGKPSWSKRWFRMLLPALVTMAVVAVIGVIVAVLLAFGVDLSTQHGALVAFRPWGAAIQGGLIILVGLRWQQVVDWGRARRVVKDWEYDKALRARPKALLCLLAYWLMIPVGPNALLRVFGG